MCTSQVLIEHGIYKDSTIAWYTKMINCILWKIFKNTLVFYIRNYHFIQYLLWYRFIGLQLKWSVELSSVKDEKQERLNTWQYMKISPLISWVAVFRLHITFSNLLCNVCCFFLLHKIASVENEITKAQGNNNILKFMCVCVMKGAFVWLWLGEFSAPLCHVGVCTFSRYTASIMFIENILFHISYCLSPWTSKFEFTVYIYRIVMIHWVYL